MPNYESRAADCERGRRPVPFAFSEEASPGHEREDQDTQKVEAGSSGGTSGSRYGSTLPDNVTGTLGGSLGNSLRDILRRALRGDSADDAQRASRGDCPDVSAEASLGGPDDCSQDRVEGDFGDDSPEGLADRSQGGVPYCWFRT